MEDIKKPDFPDQCFYSLATHRFSRDPIISTDSQRSIRTAEEVASATGGGALIGNQLALRTGINKLKKYEKGSKEYLKALDRRANRYTLIGGLTGGGIKTLNATRPYSSINTDGLPLIKHKNSSVNAHLPSALIGAAIGGGLGYKLSDIPDHVIKKHNLDKTSPEYKKFLKHHKLRQALAMSAMSGALGSAMRWDR